MIWRGDYTMAG